MVRKSVAGLDIVLVVTGPRVIFLVTDKPPPGEVVGLPIGLIVTLLPTTERLAALFGGGPLFVWKIVSDLLLASAVSPGLFVACGLLLFTFNGLRPNCGELGEFVVIGEFLMPGEPEAVGDDRFCCCCWITANENKNKYLKYELSRLRTNPLFSQRIESLTFIHG